MKTVKASRSAKKTSITKKPSVAKKRILWVDIAKAFAILCVPLSHTINLDTFARNFMFSFHMPLFFILSGYTTKLAEDFPTFRKRLKKNFLFLIVPTIAALAIYIIAKVIIDGTGITSLLAVTADTIEQFAITTAPDHIGNITSVWFLVSLFCAKTIMDLINITVKSEKNWVIFIILGLIGMRLGTSGHFMSLFFDISLVGIMFITFGLLWRKHEKVIQKHADLLFILAVTFWFSNLMKGNYIELFPRFFAGYEISVIEAVAATFSVSYFAMMFEETLQKSSKIVKMPINALVVIGQKTLVFLIIHSLDEIFFKWFWEYRNGSYLTSVFSAGLRLGVDIFFFVLYLGALKLAQNYLKNRGENKAHLKK